MIRCGCNRGTQLIKSNNFEQFGTVYNSHDNVRQSPRLVEIGSVNPPTTTLSLTMYVRIFHRGKKKMKN